MPCCKLFVADMELTAETSKKANTKLEEKKVVLKGEGCVSIVQKQNTKMCFQWDITQK